MTGSGLGCVAGEVVGRGWRVKVSFAREPAVPVALSPVNGVASIVCEPSGMVSAGEPIV